MSDSLRVFPLRVNQEWLDSVEKARSKHESKHEFILFAVEELIKQRKEGFDIIREDK